jgi:hypothetical protein
MLMQMLPMLREQGIPFQPELLEYLPLPSAMVEKWKQKLSEPKQPAPPSPQEISAQANMVKAQAAMQQVQQDGQIAQAEMPIKMQELDVRRMEAQVAHLQAMVEGMLAQMQLAGLSGQGAPLGGGMPQSMPNTFTQ